MGYVGIERNGDNMPSIAESVSVQTKEDLIEIIEQDILNDLVAVGGYEADAHVAKDEAKAAQLRKRSDEAMDHMSELIALLSYLDPAISDMFFEDQGEIARQAEKLGFDLELFRNHE